ncbi:MAG: hypothetical protein J2P27_11435 [Actinobacteria bacterium]|nr:hypothetical protein [Actinomycetota bacterium]
MLYRPGAMSGIRVPVRIRIATRHPGLPRQRMIVPIVAIAVAVLAATAAGIVVTHPGLLNSGGPQHKVSAPGSVLSFTQDANVAQSLDVSKLKSDLVQKAGGEAKNVVDAAYVGGTGKNPLIILFIGGNLAGSSSSLVSSFTGMMPGAVATSPGSLGGHAVCVPSTASRPQALCVWADNDTFGVLSSTDIKASDLAKDMRLMRPILERLRKAG